MSEPEQKYHEVAVIVANSASEAERAALLKWAHGLILIRNGPASRWSKGKDAIQLTLQSEVVWPLVKLLGRELKRVGWDERGVKSRGFILGGGVGLVLFGGQGAGIAALGTAIGVPLWIVLGAGGTFAAALIEEVGRRRTKTQSPETSYKVIEAEREIEKK
ncbi:MAG: hypothetical protein ACKVQU_20795 [Burkholderiales bacterium]